MIPCESHIEEEKPLNSFPLHLCPALDLYLRMPLRQLYRLSHDVFEHLCHTVDISNHLYSSRLLGDNPVDKLDIKLACEPF